MLRILIINSTLGALIACSSPAQPPESPAETWQPPDPGMLLDPGFVAEVDDRRPAWGYSQHGGEVSYQFTVADDVLTIERTGPEPWGQATQRIDPAEVVGRLLEFSAELSGTIEATPEEQVQVTGIGVRVMGYPPGLPVIAGRHIMVVADGEPELGPGTHPWLRQTIRFEVPEGATDIEVSIRLGMAGSLRVRAPSLTVVDAPQAEQSDANGTEDDEEAEPQ